uniref:SAM domain-containing protein n=1 Tax=Globisporangium ultimum (strain ATCC 200006 / CBS 805.95 / DAOM BR144) TaxID=431595 RepID=K3W7G5_GLOUD
MGSSGNTVLENYTIGDVLICKAHRGKLQEIAYLVDELHADINYTNQNGASALHGAAAAGQLEVVQWMMSLPTIDRSVTDHDEQTALHYAAFYGHLEVVQFLVEHGVPLDVPDKYGRLAHCSAAINGHLDVVSYLLEECPHPIDINAIDEYGSTCLHWAASKGRKEVIQYLCMKGIDVHVTSYDNKTAYQLAKDKHKTKCVQFLKSWYETSQRFVHAAEDGNNEEIIRIIAEINGAYPLRFMRDKNGKNALHWAAEAGHLSTLKLLCEHFVVWTDADKFGRNALHCAALGGHRECAFWLIRKARDASRFHSLTQTNKTPSRCAFEAGHSTLASRLQGWEDGNDEYSNNEEDSVFMSEQNYRANTEEDDAQGVSTSRPRNIDAVHNWLKLLKMDEYTKNFERDGFDTLRGVATIDEDDLIDMRVKKGHRRVVLSHIEELRNQLALLDENSNSAGQEPDSSPTLSMLPAITKQLSSSSLVSSSAAGGDAPAPRLERRGSLAGLLLDV